MSDKAVIDREFYGIVRSERRRDRVRRVARVSGIVLAVIGAAAMAAAYIYVIDVMVRSAW